MSVMEIKRPIVNQRVLKTETQENTPKEAAQDPVEVLNASMERPEELIGKTYKVKPPVSDHALYITINDVILNEGTEHEERRPYEIFLQSKEMDHFQWMVALTRLISAVFRTGSNISFLTEELLSIHDPNGGYFKKGGVFMPSLVAEIGNIIDRHLKDIGMTEKEELSKEQKELIASKKAQATESSNDSGPSDFPANATVCKKCNVKAMIKMDGCETCLNCGDSKCS